MIVLEVANHHKLTSSYNTYNLYRDLDGNGHGCTYQLALRNEYTYILAL